MRQRRQDPTVEVGAQNQVLDVCIKVWVVIHFDDKGASGGLLHVDAEEATSYGLRGTNGDV